ncbi:RAMP superfamily CRISPR-associated protein [Mycobacterium sp. 134]|uniref:RAMP superfamily CRISPR-associated protein n=1 Tax=Mycobacterium sp. 134 TaxID=3400425 RepID=UPI003AAC052F
MSQLSTIHWDIDIRALSSIIHREDYASAGSDTFTLFNREKFIHNGEPVKVPVISGNSFRGVLRRLGESLTAAALNYEGLLPVAAAHLLTNGGRLAKSARPLTDEQERTLKDLVPQVAVFGGSASGRIMRGQLAVGKVNPEVAELSHILTRQTSEVLPPVALVLGAESFTHLDDHRRGVVPPSASDSDDESGPLGRYSVQTLVAGTRLQTWVRIEDATDIQVSFFASVLAAFAEYGHLGGRVAAGHGQIATTISPEVRRGHLTTGLDWAAQLAERRDEAIGALTSLT